MDRVFFFFFCGPCLLCCSGCFTLQMFLIWIRRKVFVHQCEETTEQGDKCFSACRTCNMWRGRCICSPLGLGIVPHGSGVSPAEEEAAVVMMMCCVQ